MMLLRLSPPQAPGLGIRGREEVGPTALSGGGGGHVGWGLGNGKGKQKNIRSTVDPHVRNLRSWLLPSKETLSIHRCPQGGNPQIVPPAPPPTQTRLTVTETKKGALAMGKAF